MTRATLALPLAALLLLPACSSQKVEPVPDNETNGIAVVEDNALENIEEPDAPLAAPVEEPKNSAKALPPPEVSDDAQIAADADATGLTSRIDEPTAGGTKPAE